MRGLVVMVVLAGCGRLGIEPLEREDAALPRVDATAPPCEREGDACDDDNICTSSSSCVSGACVGSGDTACRVGSMGEEFSSTQGVAGWYYGYWDASADADGVYSASDFTEMVATGGTYRPVDWEDQPSPNFTWCYLASWGGHPGGTPRKDPIWRWTSDVSGRATVHAHVRKSDASGGGDGIGYTLFVDGIAQFAADVAWDDLVGTPVAIPITVRPGTLVDLMIDARAGDAVDTTQVEWTIDSPD